MPRVVMYRVVLPDPVGLDARHGPAGDVSVDLDAARSGRYRCHYDDPASEGRCDRISPAERHARHQGEEQCADRPRPPGRTRAKQSNRRHVYLTQRAALR